MEALGELLPRMRIAPPGPQSQRWVDVLAATECPALTQRRARRSEATGAASDPIVWAQARGANVEDVDGNIYVDLSAGFGAASVGHAQPRVVEAIAAQSGRLLHALGDLQPSDVKIQLLQRIAELFPGQSARAMLGLSGSDAIEAALKTALLATGRPGVIAFDGGYHGLSHGPLAACGYSSAFRAPFSEQLNPHVHFAPYPHGERELTSTLAQVNVWLREGGCGAVLVEPILGRGGVVVPPVEFLPGLSSLCQRHGAVLIVDEVMTGLGRTGSMFAFEATAVVPDLVCLGKALGGGLPMSACVGLNGVMNAWGTSEGEALHTGTFFGHPLSAAAALATLDVVREEKLSARAERLGRDMLLRLQRLRERHASIRDVRGRGLLLGVQLSSGELGLRCVHGMLERGFIAVPGGADAATVSFTPPLTITDEQLHAATAALGATLEQIA